MNNYKLIDDLITRGHPHNEGMFPKTLKEIYVMRQIIYLREVGSF